VWLTKPREVHRSSEINFSGQSHCLPANAVLTLSNDKKKNVTMISLVWRSSDCLLMRFALLNIEGDDFYGGLLEG